MAEIEQDNLHMKCSALSANYSSLSANHLSSRTPVQAGIR